MLLPAGLLLAVELNDCSHKRQLPLRAMLLVLIAMGRFVDIQSACVVVRLLAVCLACC